MMENRSMITIEKDISWIVSDGSHYIIQKVPTLTNANSEEYTSLSVQINLSILADEMRSGDLPKVVQYEERY